MEDKYLISIVLPGLPKTPNELMKRNVIFLKRSERKKWAYYIGIRINKPSRPKEPLKKAKVSCVRYSPRCPDYEGLVGSFKFVIDALVYWEILKDDSMKIIGVPDFKWELCKANEARIKITIESID